MTQRAIVNDGSSEYNVLVAPWSRATVFDERDRRISRRDLLATVGAGVSTATAGCSSAVDGNETTTDAATYANPVREPVVPDPTAIRVDSTYYVFASNQDREVDDNERLVPVFASEDLVDWEYRGEAFETKPDWKSGHLWAPEIARYDGRYVLYYSYSLWGDSNPGIGVATADSIEGPYTDHGRLFLSSEIGVDNSIDPYFRVEDGTPYLVWGSFHGIYGVELTPDSLDWKPGTTFLLGGRAYEAPTIVEREGYYYLFLSTGACCEGLNSTYELEVGRAESFVGSYLTRNGTDLRHVDAWGGTEDPLLTGLGDSRFAGPGHNTVVTDDAGEHWTLYHAYDTTEPGTTDDGAWRRSLMLDPITWEDGWPVIGDGTPSERRQVPTIE